MHYHKTMSTKNTATNTKTLMTINEVRILVIIQGRRLFVRYDFKNANVKYTHKLNDFHLQKGAMLCPNRSDFCFSLWRTDQNGSVVIVRQGCWQTERPETCQNNRCISDKPKSSTKSHRFCCCSNYMCNANITTTEYAEVNGALFT